MRGTKAKDIRRQARALCHPLATHRLARIVRVKEQLLLGADGKPVLAPDGKPIVTVPEHTRCTEFWPEDAYRRILKRLKRNGRITGVRYNVTMAGDSQNG